MSKDYLSHEEIVAAAEERDSPGFWEQKFVKGPPKGKETRGRANAMLRIVHPEGGSATAVIFTDSGRPESHLLLSVVDESTSWQRRIEPLTEKELKPGEVLAGTQAVKIPLTDRDAVTAVDDIVSRLTQQGDDTRNICHVAAVKYTPGMER